MPIKNKFLMVSALALVFACVSFACEPQDCKPNQTYNSKTKSCIDNPKPTPPTNTNTNSNTNSNSNKSDNTNTDVNHQNQKQSQQQTANANASASASNNSSGNSTVITTTNAGDKIPVNTAYAAAPYPTAQCFKGAGVGGQGGMFGFSINGGKIDENCAILEVARNFDAANERLAACKIKISNKYAKKAGVTLEDCMTVPVPAPVMAPPAPEPPPVQPIIVTLPAPVVNVTPTPVYIDQAPTYVPQPVYKATPRKKIKPPVGIKPCPVSLSSKTNCWEND